MFILREAHLEAFGEAALARFHHRAIGFLRTLHPRVTALMSDAAILYRCKNWSAEARGFGFLTDRHCVRYFAAKLYLEASGKTKRHTPGALNDPDDASKRYLESAKNHWQAG